MPAAFTTPSRLAELSRRGVHGGLNVGLLRDVGLDEAHRGRPKAGACQLRGFGAPFLVVDVENDRARARRNHHVDHGPAEPGRPAGHEHRSSLQIHAVILAAGAGSR